MLNLLKSSKIVQNYKDYYEAFPKTIDPSQVPRKENNFLNVHSVLSQSEFVFVDGRHLITTHNNNLLPFLNSQINPITSKSICQTQQYDKYTESKADIKSLVVNLAEWIYHLIKSLRRVRVLVIDFNSRNPDEKTWDSEVHLDTGENYTREELFSGPSRLYAKIAKACIFALQQIIQNKVKDLVLQDSVKIIAHFGSTRYSLLTATLYNNDREPGNIGFDIYQPYYLLPKELTENEWISRYREAFDSTGFFLDLASRQPNSRWKNFALFCADKTCLPSLIRFTSENKTVENLGCVIFSDDGETLVSDIVKTKNILINVMSRKFEMSGTASDYMSDIYCLEVISPFYQDLEEMLEEYVRSRADKSVLTINYKTLELSVDQNKLDSLSDTLKERVKVKGDVKDAVALTMFMADMEVLMNPPMKLNSDPQIDTQEWYENVCANIRIWMGYNMALADYNKKFVDSNLGKDVSFLLLPAIFILVMPEIRRNWDTDINSIRDVIDYVKNSKTRDAKIARAFMNKAGLKRLARLNKDELESKYKLNPPNYDDYGLELMTEELDELECDYSMLFDIFMDAFRQNWANEFKEDSKIDVLDVTSYGNKVSDYLAPMFYQLGRARLENLEKEGLIRVYGDYFTVQKPSKWVGLDVKSTVTQSFCYQAARKFPFAWKYWSETEIPRMRPSTYDQNTNKIKTRNHKLSERSEILDALNRDMFTNPTIHPIYRWDAFPPIVPDITAHLLSEAPDTRKVGPRNRVFNILKALVSETTKAETKNEDIEYKVNLVKDFEHVHKINKVRVWPFVWPKWEKFNENFHLLLPIVLRDIFYVAIPDSSIMHRDGDPTYEEAGFPTIEEDDLKWILNMHMFDNRERYSIHSLSLLLKTVAGKMATWISNQAGSVMALLRLLHSMIYDEKWQNVHSSNVKRAREETRGLFPETMYGELEALAHSMDCEEIQLYQLLLRLRDNAGITGQSSNRKIILFLVRVLEYIDELINSKYRRKKATYKICLEFGFDYLQPMYSTTTELDDNNPDYLLYRLYEFPDTYGYVKSDSKYLDLEAELLDKSIFQDADTMGVKPDLFVQVHDPIVDKNYIALAWNYTKFFQNHRDDIPVLADQNRAAAPKNSLISRLEFEAALWWVSVPKFRAKVWARSNGVEWTSCRWALWLLKLYETGKTYDGPIDPLVQCLTRFKVLNFKPISKFKPAGDIISKEFGIFSPAEVSVLERIWINNLDLQFHTIDNSFADLEIKDVFEQMPLLSLGGGGEAEGGEPAFARKALEETQLETMERRQGSYETENIKAEPQPWLHVDNYLDPDWKEDITFRQASNICYVYLPRLKPLDVTHMDRDKKKEVNERLERMPHYMPGMAMKKFEKKVQEVKGQQNLHVPYPEELILENVTVSFSDIVTEIDTGVKLEYGENGEEPMLNPFSARQLAIYHVIRHLPIWYGICYKFNVYSKLERKIFKVYPLKRKEEAVSYEEFSTDEALRNGDYHYKVVTEYEVVNTKDFEFVFQGVYGNKNQRRQLYDLFNYVYEKNRETMKGFGNPSADPGLLSETGEPYRISVIAEANQFFGMRTLQSLKSTSKLPSRSSIKYLKLFADIDKLGNEADALNMAADSDQCKIESHEFGFYSQQYWNIRLRETVAFWFAASQTPRQLIASRWDQVLAVRDMMRQKVHAVEAGWDLTRYPVGNGLVLPLACSSFRAPFIPKKEPDQEYVEKIFREDMFQLMFEATVAFKSFGLGKKMDTATFLFLSRLLGWFEVYQFLIYEKNHYPFAFKSAAFLELVRGVLFGSGEETQKFKLDFEKTIDWEPIDSFMEELEEEANFLYVEREQDAEKLMASVSRNYMVFREYVEKLISNDLKYLVSDYLDIDAEGTWNALIRTANRPKLIKSVINKILNGEVQFRTTEKEFSSFGIDVDEGGVGDSSILWEQLEEHLTHAQSEFFGDPSSTDRELDALLQEIRSGGVSRRVIKADKRAVKRIVKELEESRQVMMYFLANPESDPRTDPDFIKLVYNIYDARDQGGKKKASAKSQRIGANNFESELLLRRKVNQKLRDQSLKLVYGGDYERKSEGDKEPSKRVKKLYKSGLTMYITADKRRKMEVKMKNTLVESMLISMLYTVGNPKERMYFMQQKDLESIKNEYKNAPTVKRTTDSGQEVDVPIVAMIDTETLDKIFSVKGNTPVEKAREFFQSSLAPLLDIDLDLLVFTVKGENVRFRESSKFENPNKGESTTLISLVLVENKAKKTVYFFEPTFALARVQ